MKKLLLFTCIAMGMMALTSCDKDKDKDEPAAPDTTVDHATVSFSAGDFYEMKDLTTIQVKVVSTENKIDETFDVVDGVFSKDFENLKVPSTLEITYVFVENENNEYTKDTYKVSHNPYSYGIEYFNKAGENLNCGNGSSNLSSMTIGKNKIADYVKKYTTEQKTIIVDIDCVSNAE